MLKVSPKSRPGADELLSNDCVTYRCELYDIGEDALYTSDADILLKTIRLPSGGKIKQMAGKLPKSNYGDCSTQSSRKSQMDSLHDSFAKSKNNAYGMDTQDTDQKPKLESLLQN
jgi:hypothetical protein